MPKAPSPEFLEALQIGIMELRNRFGNPYPAIVDVIRDYGLTLQANGWVPVAEATRGYVGTQFLVCQDGNWYGTEGVPVDVTGKTLCLDAAGAYPVRVL